LVATVSIALYLLRREFISPALALVEYIRDASRSPSAQEPRLPSLWQTWVGVVSNSFRESREAAGRVRESEERLQQILNNTSSVVYVRDLNDRFILVNQPFERLLGVTQEDVVERSLDEVFPADTAAEFRANDQRVIEQSVALEFEEELTLDDGVHTYISIKFPLYDTQGRIYAVCGISTDITKRKQSEDMLRQVAMGLSEARGEEIFDALVLHLSDALGTDYALIGTLEAEDTVRTRALCAQGRIVDNFSYSLQGSPCQDVVGQQFRYYPSGIQGLFPDDAWLQQSNMDSYAAIPLFDSAGEVLGLLAVLHSRPLQDEAMVGSILRIFAGRAASELERARADEALRASEASYRAIFEASEDAIFVHDIDTGAIVDVNSKTCEVYGYSYQEMLEIDVGTLSSGIPPYTQEDAMRLVARAVAGEKLHFEWHRRNRDNTLHWDEVFARRLPIGGRDRILVHTREITERKEAEQKLRASEEQYRLANRRLRESEAFKSAVVENALLGVITIDEAGSVLEFNPAAVAMFGYDKSQAIGSNLAELIIPEAYREAHNQGLARYLRTGKSRVLGKRGETTALRADGSEFPVELSMSANLVGDVIFFTAFIADLTEKRAAEAALRASEEQYRSIFNATSDAMILWDAEARIVDLNSATWKMGGYSKDGFLAIPIEQHIHEVSREALKEFMEAVGEGKSIRVEATALKKDGTIMNIETRTVPMQYRGIPHVLSITHDITEQKKAAEELARQREALRQSEKLSAMGELLAGVAHELNNPLAILMGRTALLQDKAKEPAIQSDVEKIHTAADRCGRIVRTFLSMARQKPPERRLANLHDVLTGAIDLLGYGLRTSGIELETRLQDDLPEQSMDADQIGQIMVNLLVNAQHAVAEQPEPRRITIDTGVDGKDTYIRIRDNGPGVPQGLRTRIFDPFFTTKKDNIGTGVGLSVSRGIAREHGGDLLLEESEKGTAFLLRLPIDADSVPVERTQSKAGAQETAGVRVLVVEDEPDIAEMLVEILESAGLAAAWASSGLKALEWLKAHQCDLILSDIRMPDVDGPGLWRALERNYPHLLHRIAFITGDTLSAAITPFLKQTKAPLLEKPFTPEQVLALVAQLEPTDTA